MKRLEELISKAQSGDCRAKETLVEENSGLIWAVVRRFLGRGAEADDLYQLGCLGFLKAVEGFDLQFGTQFSTYAVPKISGEIRRFLRDDGAIKVSRTLKEQAQQIRTARNRLSLELGREPLLSEVSDATGFSPEDIAAAELAVMPTDSLQRPAGEDGCSLEQLIPGEEIEERILEEMSLRDAISALDPRQKAVIRMRYFRSMTQEKTAAVLGVSQVQVSRIERKAVAELRRILMEE